MENKALYIGLMSGTSLDAIDAALMDFSVGNRLVECHSIQLDAQLQHEIRLLNSPQPDELARAMVLGKQIALLSSEAVSGLLQKAGIASRDIIAIGSHGQTLRHVPTGTYRYSLQVGDPSTLAELTGITVVADFRNRDMAAGGQGAPLVPAFHQSVFSSDTENRAIINIGGMANASVFMKDGRLLGFDTGPGNVLMNHWIHLHHGEEYDPDGAWARTGKVNATLLAQMLEEPYFSLPPPKSTGREKFDGHWLSPFKPELLKAEDVQRTLLELTATSIYQALPNEVDRLFVCGGGAKNHFLLERLATLCNKPVASTAELGLAPEWVEAAAFAWLAKQALAHLPGNLPAATGAAGPRILGGIYAGKL